MMDKKSDDGQESLSIESLLLSSMSSLAQRNMAAYEIILKQAKAGFFEKRQTSGSLKKLAVQLLDTLPESVESYGGLKTLNSLGLEEQLT